MPAWEIASSTARSASRSDRPVELKGSTGTKSTVPAMVVFRPSIGKRVTVRMPDSPDVSLSQLSFFPAPSEVTTPMPVTTTIGQPSLSRGADMCPLVKRLERASACAAEPARWLLDRLDQSETFALPMAGTLDDNLVRSAGLFNLKPGGVVGREQRAARDRERRQRQAQRKLGFQRLAEDGPRGPHGIAGVLLQESLFLRSHRVHAGRAGNQIAGVAGQAELRPHPLQRLFDRSRLLARSEIGEHTTQPRIRLGPARRGMLARLQHQEHAGRTEREAAMRLAAGPERGEFALEVEVAEFVEEQQILALAIMGGADEGNVALAALDAGQRNPRRVDRGGFLAHEGARGTGDAMHDRDIA